ncbi:LacI family DNA-binding transcriptional regulator [Streptomyces marincola]|uniref:HTH lacI-type domain-containing protein n=1 Tax=Streptomyces marincola TaxID=2878388 RepID=A0A1W7CS37_9ACTN|nr:LacI family DNA-binding transcriptional regulator [Streptomyces marincola]ARQ67614.1 hypothetical protein CAG99_01125 [Streptomyces marincola]
MPHGSGQGAGRPGLMAVAERAAVSPMTVTRVLRDDPRVLPGTRERVLAAVAELAYLSAPEPPAAAGEDGPAGSAAADRGTGLVGVVVTDVTDPFASRLASGVDAAVRRHGLRLLIGDSRRDGERERGLVADLAGRVDGIVVMPAGPRQEHLSAVAGRGVPVVCAGGPPAGFEADHVVIDDYGGAKEATERLLALGHRRIGFLGPRPDVWSGAERLRGHRTALRSAGLPLSEELVRREGAGAAERAATQLLALPEPPSALFCCGERYTIGAFRAVRAVGARTVLAGFDDFELADTLGLPLTVQICDSGELGRQAGRLLLDRMGGASGRRQPPRRMVVPTRAVRYGEGDGHRPPAPAPAGADGAVEDGAGGRNGTGAAGKGQRRDAAPGRTR